MKLPILVTRKKQLYVIALAVVIALGVLSFLTYSRFHSAKLIEAEAPSATVTLPDSPSIKSATDLESAHDTFDKLNTINNDFQKEEDQLKQLASKLQ